MRRELCFGIPAYPPPHHHPTAWPPWEPQGGPPEAVNPVPVLTGDGWVRPAVTASRASPGVPRH